MRQGWLSRYEASDAAALLAVLSATAHISAGVGDKNYALLKVDPQHASLHLKKVGKESNCGQCALVSTTGRSVQISHKALSRVARYDTGCGSLR